MKIYSENVVLGGANDPLQVTPATVEIERGVILSVFPNEKKEGAQDLGERLLTPAMINGHTHLPMVALRGIEAQALRGNVVENLYFRVERCLLPEDIRVFAQMGAYECMLSGVGTVWEHYYGGREIAEALQAVGLPGVIAPTLQDLSGPGADQWQDALDATTAIDSDPDLRAAGIVAALGPHATDTVSDELWSVLLGVATERALPVHVHLAQSIEEYVRSFDVCGGSPVQRLQKVGALDADTPLLLVHGLYVSKRDLALLSPARHVLGYCPLSQLQFDFPGDAIAWDAAGLRIQIGTDSVACNDSMNIQRELSVAAAGPAYSITHSKAHEEFFESPSLESARGLRAQRMQLFEKSAALRSPEHLLSAVWSTPGSLHPHLPGGEIRAGARANLALWDLQHPALWPAADPLRSLIFCDATKALDGLMLNGKWVGGGYTNMAANLLDDGAYRALRDEAAQRLSGLLSRAGLST